MIPTELIPEKDPELPTVPLPPNASVTHRPAFPDAKEIIAKVRAADAERGLMAHGYREMAEEHAEWTEASFTAQAETLPNE
jgi:hypothetical protein